MSKVTKEEVEAFLHGSNPMEHIIKIECGYEDTKAKVYYRDENGKKQCQLDDFYPFCWAKQDAARRLYKGNRDTIKGEMAKYGITCKGLRTTKDDGTEPERMKNGYRVLFYAIRPMTYQQFQKFFENGGVPLSSKNRDGSDSGEKNYVTVAPNEQHMIRTGKRLFKGYEDYDELVRMQWDLETTGLNPKKDTIDQIGLRTNKGFEKIITITGNTPEERLESQRKAMIEQYEIMREIDPDVMSGYNSENFDWFFEEEQWKKYGTTLKEASKNILREGIYKKKREAILKLGGEMERYYPTIVGSINITDGLHAVRRAMALDSNIKSATLKNISKDFNLKKKNRVYVPGISISDIWNDLEEHYAFCEEDGDWYLYNPNYKEGNRKNLLTLDYFKSVLENDNDIVDEATGEIVIPRSYPEGTTAEQLYEEYLGENGFSNGEQETEFKKGLNPNNSKFTMFTRNRLMDGYELKSGRFIVERYLLDDIFETDAVELQFNQANFQVAKLLPVSFERAATMGTAAVWSALMLAWSMEHDLAIPEAQNIKLETGGLSRQMRTGWVKNVLKNDYNALYPTIEITFDYKVDVDITDIMITMLRYMLTTREKYKAEKKKWGKECEKLKLLLEQTTDNDEKEKLKKKLYEAKRNKGRYDKLQISLKVCCNAWFGSVSSNIFYWNSQEVGSRITCTGRQMFRLLIYHLTNVIGKDNKNIKEENYNPADYIYTPLVGDSVTGDTPLFVKNDSDGSISIRSIASLFGNEDIHRDVLGREYFYPKNGYKVLCRSGWMKPNYVYRHKTNKPIYEISNEEMCIECTEDHSLFDSNQREIKPSEITEDTEFEYYTKPIKSRKNAVHLEKDEVIALAKATAQDTSEYGMIPEVVLNTTRENKKLFVYTFNKEIEDNVSEYSKTIRAGLQFLNKNV